EWIKISDTNTATLKMPSSDIWVAAVYRSTKPHKVTLFSDDSYGTITFEDGSTEKEILPGTTVTLTVTPIDGYRLNLITGVPEGYDLQTHTFEMPSGDLEIHATFTQLKTYEISFTITPSRDYGTVVPAYNQETGLLVLGAVPDNSSILFLGWYDDQGNLLCEDEIYAFYPDRNMALEMRFAQGYAVMLSTMHNGTITLFPERISPFFTDTTSHYLPGETVRLIGTPNDGYMLESYYYVYYSDYEDYRNGQSDLLHKLDGDTITMIADSVIVTANFIRAYDINTTVNDENAGVAIGAGKYQTSSLVTLTAEANEGYEFVNWTENGSEVSKDASYSFYATSNRDLVANFRKLVNVTVTASDDALGAVSGGGIYSPGTSVTATASPGTDCVFVNWTKDGVEVSTAANYTFTAESDVSLVANFRRLYEYTVTVQPSNAEHGSVSGGGAYKEGSSVTVTATPFEDYYFVNWTKDGSVVSTSQSYTFPAENAVLVANFEHVKVNTVTVLSSNETYGTVSGGGSFKTGQSATAIASPKTDCVFVNWTINGSEVSTAASYTFTVEEDVTLTANFRPLNDYTVTVTASNSTYGTVTGGGSYKEGSTVTVTAAATGGNFFVNWTLNGEVVSTNPSYTFTVSGNVDLVANFRLPNVYNVTLSSSNEKYGSVSGGGACSEGSSVTVTATANEGYRFIYWKENGNIVCTTAEYTFTADSNRTLVAEFGSSHGFVITFEVYEDDGVVDPSILVTDENGYLPYVPMPTLYDGMEFYYWYYVKDGSLHYVYENTVFTEDTRVLCFYEDPYGDNQDERIKVYAHQRQYGTATADKEYADFGEVVHLTAAPNPGFKFLRWEVYGDETGVLFGDPYSTTTTYIRGLSGELYAIFEYDFPDRVIEVDMPAFLERGQPLRFTTTMISDTDMTQQPEKFFDLTYYFSTIRAEGAGPLTLLSKTINGNTCVIECEKSPDLIDVYPFTISVCISYGMSGKDNPWLSFDVQLLDRIDGTAETCTADGVMTHWVCTETGQYFADAQGKTEITLEDTVIPAHNALNKVDAKAPTAKEEGNIEYWVCGKCGKCYSDPEGKNEIQQADTIIPKLTVCIVRFVNEDGTVLQSGEVEIDTLPVYTGDVPTKEADAQYTYTFAGWDKQITEATENTTYTATYDKTVNEYTVEFVNDNGSVLQSGRVAYGETPVYTGEEPVKEGDAENTYTFAGWDKEITAVTGDATYTATFTKTINTYKVTLNVDGALTVITVEYGSVIETPETPEKEKYDFIGWYTDEECTVPADLTQPVTGDVTFFAGWEEIVYTVEGTLFWNANDGRDLVFSVHRNRMDDDTYDLFTGIVFNGKEVDESCYTAEKGSVKLTVNSSLFDGLASEEYELTVLFEDGSVTATVTVEQKADAPITGESALSTALCVMAVSGLAFFAAAVLFLRRRKTAV
ncbi:MAG: InlB B-repeat-containing protein, partial [Clostridia bacterium]|nr:InlB B-repeat-containing protein [Clostridia bacterium]